jgi:hypothetical protein
MAALGASQAVKTRNFFILAPGQPDGLPALAYLMTVFHCRAGRNLFRSGLSGLPETLRFTDEGRVEQRDAR